jgi:hypothetical protein
MARLEIYLLIAFSIFALGSSKSLPEEMSAAQLSGMSISSSPSIGTLVIAIVMVVLMAANGDLHSE